MYTSPANMPMPAQRCCSLRPTCRYTARPVLTTCDLHQLVASRNATSSHAASLKQRRLRPLAATDGAHEDLTDAEGLTDVEAVDETTSAQQQDAESQVDAATTAAPSTPAQPTAAAQQRTAAAQTTKQRMVATAVSPDFVAKAKVVGLGVAGVAAAVGVGFMLRKVASAQMPKMQKVPRDCLSSSTCCCCVCKRMHVNVNDQVMEQRQLQKESMQRLNSFMEQVCSNATIATHSLSIKPADTKQRVC